MVAFAAVVARPGSPWQKLENTTAEVSPSHHSDPVWGAVSGWGIMGPFGNYAPLRWTAYAVLLSSLPLEGDDLTTCPGPALLCLSALIGHLT